jgi:hypothetical protein
MVIGDSKTPEGYYDLEVHEMLNNPIGSLAVKCRGKNTTMLFGHSQAVCDSQT